MMASMSSDPQARMAASARLFVALWPDAGLREQLLRIQAAWRWPPGAALTPPGKLHLTLHFIGAVERASVPALTEALQQVTLEPVTVVLDVAEVWHGGVAVLRAGALPAALERLHLAVLDRAEHALGVDGERRRFKPHVTLARKAAGAMPAARSTALTWAGAGMALVESVPGPAGGYRSLQVYSAGS